MYDTLVDPFVCEVRPAQLLGFSNFAVDWIDNIGQPFSINAGSIWAARLVLPNRHAAGSGDEPRTALATLSNVDHCYELLQRELDERWIRFAPPNP